MMVATIVGTFMSIAIHFDLHIQAFGKKVVLVLQLSTSLDVSTPGLSL